MKISIWLKKQIRWAKLQLQELKKKMEQLENTESKIFAHEMYKCQDTNQQEHEQTEVLATKILIL